MLLFVPKTRREDTVESRDAERNNSTQLYLQENKQAWWTTHPHGAAQLGDPVSKSLATGKYSQSKRARPNLAYSLR